MSICSICSSIVSNISVFCRCSESRLGGADGSFRRTGQVRDVVSGSQPGHQRAAAGQNLTSTDEEALQSNSEDSLFQDSSLDEEREDEHAIS